jgi:hypothetical protein
MLPMLKGLLVKVVQQLGLKLTVSNPQPRPQTSWNCQLMKRVG